MRDESNEETWNEKYFNRHYPPRAFRLWCIIMTESDPTGGWWVDDGETFAQSSERDVLNYYLEGMQCWAEEAVSAHVIIPACGANLALDDSRQQVISYIST